MIAHMRKPTTQNRIVANSLPEIANGLEDIATSLRREGEKGPYRALADGNLYNALACWLLGQPKEQRLDKIRKGLKLYAAALDSDDPVDFEKLSSPDEPKYRGGTPRRVRPDKANGSDQAAG